MLDTFKIIRPLLHTMDPEDAHDLTIKALKFGAGPIVNTPTDPKLERTIAGVRFSNPVGMAAGFDKNGEIIAPLVRMGFGFVEIGTVTPKPQAGNEKPRVFRDNDRNAVINRMGFPNKGADVVERNLSRYRKNFSGLETPIGVNIGMNKDQADPVADYAHLIERFAPLADYLTINISSPNTPGLRDLQAADNLGPFLQILTDMRDRQHARVPLFVKLAPDLDAGQMDSISQILLQSGVDGVILTNTTLSRPETYEHDTFMHQPGGLSGAPLTDLSTNMVAGFYDRIGHQLPIVGAGGIMNGHQARQKLAAGASMVQFYSGMIFEGPLLAKRIIRALAAK